MTTSRKVSWDEFKDLCHELLAQIIKSNKEYAWVVGVNRGGLVPSVMVSHGLGIPHIAMEKDLVLPCYGKNMLVIDEIHIS